MEGPIVNNAYGSQMRAIALEDHRCVYEVNIEFNRIEVFRLKMFTITSDTNITTDSFNLTNLSFVELNELHDFVVYHSEIANKENAFTKEQMYIHKQAIKMIKDELKKRKEYKRIFTKFMLEELIKDKELELEILKKKLIKLEIRR